MSQHRIFCTAPLSAQSPVVLDGPQAHYLGHVLRVRPGDEITLFDGSGCEFQAKVSSVSRKKVELHTDEPHTTTTESPLKVTLIQALIRGERMDFCVQKCTELGVQKIVPVFTERTVVKLPDDRAAKRVDHWHKIAVAACEQSGRVIVPIIERPLPIQDAVANSLDSETALVILDPWAGAPPLHRLPAPASDQIAVCVGPEGGFSNEELEFLRDAGAVSVTCGPRVLRSETAGITAVAACQMAWGDWVEGSN